MKLLLIRHAESEHNVKGLLAGTTDSSLTNHGIIQTQKLGQHLAREVNKVISIFTSDLRRAKITAEAIRDAQLSKAQPDQGPTIDITVSQVLREQHFGSQELQPWTSKLAASEAENVTLKGENLGVREKESHESMSARSNVFLKEHLLPRIHASVEGDDIIVVVSHGLILSTLWKCLLLRFSPRTVSLGPQVTTVAGFRPLEYLPSWSNTGYLELEIRSLEPSSKTESAPHSQEEASAIGAAVQGPSCWRMIVLKVNCTAHLKNLKRTRGGVGSATYDSRQRRLEGFLTKRLKKGAKDAESE